MAITWKNVASKSNEAANRLITQGNEAIQSSIAGIGKVGEDFRQNQIAAESAATERALRDTARASLGAGVAPGEVQKTLAVSGFDQGIDTTNLSSQLSGLAQASGALNEQQQQSGQFVKGFFEQEQAKVQAKQDLANQDYQDFLETSVFKDALSSQGTARGDALAKAPKETFFDFITMGGADLDDEVREIKTRHPDIPEAVWDKAFKDTGYTKAGLSGNTQLNTDVLEKTLVDLNKLFQGQLTERTLSRKANLAFDKQRGDISTKSANIQRIISSEAEKRNRRRSLNQPR